MSFESDEVRVAVVSDAHDFSQKELLEICRNAIDGRLIYRARNVITMVAFRGTPFAVKAFRIPWGLRKWIYGTLRASKARRSFENAGRLISLGFSTPMPIGFVELGTASKLTESFYVSHFTGDENGTFTIRDVLLQSDFPRRLELLKQFGRFVCMLHNQGVLHRDLSPGNVLVKIIGENPVNYRFDLVDLNRMSFRCLSRRERTANLKMLWATDDDLREIVSGYVEGFNQHHEGLLELAIRASANHKRVSNIKEVIKKGLRQALLQKK